MELLIKKSQDLYEELVNISDAIQFIAKKTETAETEVDREHFSREEFRLLMDMAKTYSSLSRQLNLLAEENAVLAKKIKANADSIMQVGVIDAD